jgi:UDP-glucose 4-epimerase
MSKKNILVTGGAGYIGSHVVKLLGEKDFHTITYDNLSTGYKDAVVSGDFIEGDLADLDKLETVFKSNDIFAVIHFAGSIIVPESVEKPINYYQNNTVNSLNLMNLCLKHNVHNFVFSSTAAVYGVQEDAMMTEETATAPINPYGESKLMTEHMLRDISHAYPDFNYVALRYFNVSGADPDGKIGQAFPGATHLIKVNCEAATGKRDKTYIFGTDFNTPDGTGVRDYIHVSDLASAHLEALNFLIENKRSEVFNCGYGKGFSVKEVIKAVKDISGVDYLVIETDKRAGDPAALVADSSKLRKKTKWDPQYNDLNFIIQTAFDWEKSDILKKWKENE